MLSLHSLSALSPLYILHSLLVYPTLCVLTFYYYMSSLSTPQPHIHCLSTHLSTQAVLCVLCVWGPSFTLATDKDNDSLEKIKQ